MVKLIKIIPLFLSILFLPMNNMLAFSCGTGELACDSWNSEIQCQEDGSNSECDKCLNVCLKSKFDIENIDYSKAGVVTWWLQIIGSSAAVATVQSGCIVPSAALMMGAGISFLVGEYMAQTMTETELNNIKELAETTDVTSQKMAFEQLKDIYERTIEDLKTRKKGASASTIFWGLALAMAIVESTPYGEAFSQCSTAENNNKYHFPQKIPDQLIANLKNSKNDDQYFVYEEAIRNLNNETQSISLEKYNQIRPLIKNTQLENAKKYLVQALYSINDSISTPLYAGANKETILKQGPLAIGSLIIGAKVWAAVKTTIKGVKNGWKKGESTPVFRAVMAGAMTVVSSLQIVWLNQIQKEYEQRLESVESIIKKIPDLTVDIDNLNSSITLDSFNIPKTEQENIDISVDMTEDLKKDILSKEDSLKKQYSDNSNKSKFILSGFHLAKTGIGSANELTKQLGSSKTHKALLEAYNTHKNALAKGLVNLNVKDLKKAMTDNAKKNNKNFDFNDSVGNFLNTTTDQLQSAYDGLIAEGEDLNQPFKLDVPKKLKEKIKTDLVSETSENSSNNDDNFLFDLDLSTDKESAIKDKENLNQANELAKYNLGKNLNLGDKNIPLWERLHNRYILKYKDLGKIKINEKIE